VLASPGKEGSEKGGNETIALKTPKLYTFTVYPGNYPHFIEQALLKRGIWKPFDKKALEIKIR